MEQGGFEIGYWERKKRKKKEMLGAGIEPPTPSSRKKGKEMGLKGIEHATWGKRGRELIQ